MLLASSDEALYIWNIKESCFQPASRDCDVENKVS